MCNYNNIRLDDETENILRQMKNDYRSTVAIAGFLNEDAHQYMGFVFVQPFNQTQITLTYEQARRIDAREGLRWLIPAIWNLYRELTMNFSITGYSRDQAIIYEYLNPRYNDESWDEDEDYIVLD